MCKMENKTDGKANLKFRNLIQRKKKREKKRQGEEKGIRYVDYVMIVGKYIMEVRKRCILFLL